MRAIGENSSKSKQKNVSNSSERERDKISKLFEAASLSWPDVPYQGNLAGI